MDCKDCTGYMVTKEQFSFVLCQLFKVLIEGWKSSDMSYREVSKTDITEDAFQIINALGLGVPEDIMEAYIVNALGLGTSKDIMEAYVALDKEDGNV